MSSLFKSRAKAITDPAAMEAWQLAKPFQEQALTGLSNVAQNVGANPAYSGPRVADLNPFQINSANRLGNFADNTAGYANNFMGVGADAMAPSGAVGNNAADIFSRASMDPTQTIINNAGMFANNPFASGMIDAANRDTARMLTEQQLPGLARSAAGTGNTNSTRAGVESAIATRGAMDRMTDTAANIRGNLFNTGLNMSQNQFNQNLSNMMNANSGLMNAGAFGSNMLGAGQQFANNNFLSGFNAGDMFQNQDQNQLNANMAQFNETWQNPLAAYGALGNAASNVRAQSVAGISQQPSIAAQIGGGLMAAGSLGWKPFSDIRMKENIVKEGQLPSGLNVYSYEYKEEFKDIAGHGRFTGVKAQEVLEKFPDAVGTADNGYFFVDYSKLN